MSKLFVLLALVVATGLIAAGCGGDDDDDGGGEDTTSAEEGATGEGGSAAVSQVNQICADLNEELTPAWDEIQEFEGFPPDDVNEQFVETLTSTTSESLDEMRAVEGAEDDSGITEFIEAAQESTDELEADPVSISYPSSYAEADEAAEEAELTDCVGVLTR